ncbi:MAG: hypothetical protein M2R45_04030 [Verrucomicrobia subdivision 3 bacterium]|nr:hypothetical protein [Limisphaerales bacterium]MCS1416986.1 hypothetical protein [Limisphaerales bacterium]
MKQLAIIWNLYAIDSEDEMVRNNNGTYGILTWVAGASKPTARCHESVAAPQSEVILVWRLPQIS